MKTLEEKIFQVLSGKIEISEFENWLYNSDEIIKSMGRNSFVYDLVCINYNSSNSLEKIEKVLIEHKSEKELLNYFTVSTYFKLSNSQSNIEIYNNLDLFMRYFDFNTNSSVKFGLYLLYSDYDLINLKYYNKSEYYESVKNESLVFLNKFKSLKNIDGIYALLNNPRKVICGRDLMHKPTLKQKIFAFFKKI